MKVVILCGGEGTRLRDTSEVLPKPMLPIGDKPILWHIMKYYASFGLREFILCLGYKSEVFVDYFLNYRARNNDITLSLRDCQNVQFHGEHSEDWKITLVNTGSSSMTGYRVWRIAKYLDENDFLLTYGDGLSSIDIKRTVDFHKERGKLVTISAVHPSGRFGEMDLIDKKVVSFNEKPQTTTGYINGGFMVLKRQFIERYLHDDCNLILEQEPLMTAARHGDVAAYCHDGFWQCMDTPREHKMLNQMWNEGKAEWRRW